MYAGVPSTYLRALFATGLIAATSFTQAGAAAAPSSPDSLQARNAQLAQHYAQLPLSFEANQGQAIASEKFLAHGSGYSLYLARNGVVLALCQAAQRAVGRNAGPAEGRSRNSAACSAVRMQLESANSAATPVGEEQLPGTVNYFIGSDPSKWRTGIPTYARVRYRSIYPGIDLVYYGNHRELEYDFVVAPGANANLIRMRFGGAGHVRRAANGDLVLRVERGEARFRRPEIYQMVGGQRVPITGDFVLTGDGAVRFRLGRYDRSRPLTIDPALEYSTFLGGSGGAVANAIAVDASGNAYVTGVALAGFPVTAGALQSADKAGQPTIDGNAFVAKLNVSGTALVYATYMGGSGNATPNSGMGDGGTAIAVDANGNAYVTGYTWSSDFPVTPGALQTTNKAAADNGSDAFVAKLNPTGSALIYSTYLGGSGSPLTEFEEGDFGYGIAVDASGNAYIAGTTSSTDFPVTPGALQTANNEGQSGVTDGFVAKLNATGTALVYSTYLGGNGGPSGLGYGDKSLAITIDAAGNAYVTGAAGSTNFPVTQGAYQTTNHSPTTAFVTKLNPGGTAVLSSTYLGGSNGAAGQAIAVDATGNIYVAGTTGSADFPVTAGALETTMPGPWDGFVAKLNPSVTTLLYSTFLGGSGGSDFVPNTSLIAPIGDTANGLALDSAGDAYVVGSTSSSNFPVTTGALQPANGDNQSGCLNGYIAELKPDASALVYSTYLGGNCNGDYQHGVGDTVYGIVLDGDGGLYVAGSAQSANFPVTSGAFQTVFNAEGYFPPNNENAFVTKLDTSVLSTATTPTVTVTPTPATIPSALPFTAAVSVSGGSGGPVPTGTVTMFGGAYPLTATLSGGSATLNIPAGMLVGGSCSSVPRPSVLTANYLPDSASSSTYNYASGIGSVYVVGACVNVKPSASSLTAAQAQSQALPVSITVSSVSGLPAPVGTVILTAGSYVSAAATLTGGQATISVPAGTLQEGYNQVVADYAGDSNYYAQTVSALIAVTPLGSNQTLWIDTSPINIAAGATTGNVSSVLISPNNVAMYGETVTLACAVIATPSNATSPVTCSIPSSWIIGSNTNPILTVNSTAATTVGDYVVEITATLGSVVDTAVVDVTVTAAPSFTISGPSVTVVPGATTGNTSTITLTPTGGFTGSVALTATVTTSPAGAVSPPTFSFGSTSPVSITGANAGTATLTIATTAGGSCSQAYQTQRGIPWYAGGGAVLACALFFGIPARRRRWRTMAGMLALLAALTGGVLSCGGSSGSGCPSLLSSSTSPGIYTVTVTGTSGAVTAAGTVTLTVQ